MACISANVMEFGKIMIDYLFLDRTFFFKFKFFGDFFGLPLGFIDIQMPGR